MDNDQSLIVRARRPGRLAKLDMNYERVIVDIANSPIATAERCGRFSARCVELGGPILVSMAARND